MRSFKQIWSRVTGKDIRAKYPQQQGAALERVGNFVIMYPYGMYCDLPDDALLRVLAPGVAVPVTVARPSDASRNEPTIFHPDTNSRIIFRANGEIDIETDGKYPVNINCSQANVTASGDIQATAGGAASISASSITLDGDDVTITATAFTVNAPLSLFNGATTATGLVSGSDLSAGGVSYKLHTHSQGNDSRGDAEVETNAPTGA